METEAVNFACTIALANCLLCDPKLISQLNDLVGRKCCYFGGLWFNIAVPSYTFPTAGNWRRLYTGATSAQGVLMCSMMRCLVIFS